MKSDCRTYGGLTGGEYLRVAMAAGFIAAAVLLLWTAFSCVRNRRDLYREKAVASPSEVSASQTAGESAASSDHVPARAAVESALPVVSHQNEDFVRVKDLIPDIEVELVYATDKNFTGQTIYDFNDAWLRYGTVKKLQRAQEKLKKQGAGLKIWDAFRPVKAQYRLWEVCPDPKYVSDPRKGFSSHSRGNTVDVTLVGPDGNELKMPTGFDNFTGLADRDYADVKDKDALSNVRLLEKTMKECGFKPYDGEWWHFSDTVRYDVAEDFIPG